MKSTLSIYSFSIREKHTSKDKYLNLLAPIPSGNGLVVKDIIDHYINKHSTIREISDESKSFKLSHPVTEEFPNYYYVGTILSTGDYGYQADIIDVETDKVNYTKSMTELEEKKFVISFIIPKNISNDTRKGIVIYQNIGQHGIVTLNKKMINSYFSEEFSLQFDQQVLSPTEFIDTYVNEKSIKAIEFYKSDLSADDSDNMDIELGEQHLVIKKVKFRTSNAFQQFKSKLKTLSLMKNSMFTFKNEEYEDVKLTINFKGKDRNVRMKKIDAFSIIEDLDDVYYKNGQFDYHDIHNYIKTDVATAYIDRLMNE